jgi:hypothetical protein
MTESIVQMERAQSEEQAVARAVASLRQSGEEHATPETVEWLSQNFEPLQKMRGILKTYGDTINEITDNIDASDEERIQAYAELREHVIPQYQEAAKELEHEIRSRRQEYHTDVFGIPEMRAPAATPADRNSAAMSYRDALYRLHGADVEELDTAASIAEASGDMALLRAVGLIADQRGASFRDGKRLVYRYLERAGQKTTERYIARNMLPTDSTIGALVSSFEPPRIARGALAPSAAVLDGRRRQRAQRQNRDDAIFRG